MDDRLQSTDPEELRLALLASGTGGRSAPAAGRLTRVLAWVGVVALALSALLMSLLPSRRSHQQELLQEADVGPSPAVRISAGGPGERGHR